MVVGIIGILCEITLRQAVNKLVTVLQAEVESLFANTGSLGPVERAVVVER